MSSARRSRELVDAAGSPQPKHAAANSGAESPFVAHRRSLRKTTTDRMPECEPFDLFQRHTPGGLPVMRLGLGTRAVGPSVIVHRQGVVWLRTLMARPSAEEVDAIVHR